MTWGLEINNSDKKMYCSLAIIEFAIIVLGLFQCLIGFLQILGVLLSNHSGYLVTGTFYNPGPYGCFIAMIMPVALDYLLCSNLFSKFCKIVRVMSVVYILLAFLILPITESRLAWLICIWSIVFIFLVRKYQVIRSLRINRFCIIGSIVLLISVIFLLYNIRVDSVDGRVLIWKVAFSMLKELPIEGLGWDNVAGAYGDAQEALFANVNVSDNERCLAGAPFYLYNEYLQIAVAYGVVAAFFFIGLMVTTCVIFFKNKMWNLLGVTMSFGICCFASYPFQFLIFKLLFLILVLVALSRWKNKRVVKWIMFPILVLLLSFCYDAKPVDVNPLIEEATYCKNLEQYQQSIKILKEVSRRTSEITPLYLIGQNFEEMQMLDSADYYYNRACNRIPNRLYPHYLKMMMYFDANDSIRYRQEASIIMAMQPKVETSSSRLIKSQAIRLLNSVLRDDDKGNVID